MNKTRRNNAWLIVASTMLALGVFVVDMLVPLGIAGGVPYVALVLVSLWLPGRQYTLVAAMVGATLTILGYFYSPPGSILWVVFSNRLLALFAIWVTAILSLHRKGAEEILRESEKRYRILVEQASDGIFVTDAEGNYVDVNSSGCKMLGYTRDDILQFNLRDIVPEEDLTLSPLQLDELRSGKAIISERRLKHKNGSMIPVEINAKMLGDGRLQGITRDITERKRAEESLRESESRFRKIFEKGPIGIVLIDLDFRFVKVNQAFCHMVGYTERELIQRTFADVTHPEDVEMDVQHVRRLFQGEIPGFQMEKRYIARSQEVIWGNLTASAIRDQEGKVLYGLGMIENITERKQTVKLLQESAEKFRTLLDAAPMAVVIVDDNGRIVIINVKTEELFGYDRDDLLGQTVEILLPERLRDSHVNHRMNYLIDPRVRPMCPGRDLFGQKKDGSQFPIDVGLSAIKTMEGILVMSFITDITKRKHAENQIRTALQEKEVLLREIHHRVKNNLQTVSSLLSLHANATRDEQAREVLRESQNRVKSMAFVHEKLYHSQDLARVDYAKYIQSLTTYLLRSYGVNPAIINLEVGEGVFLGVDIAVACGLIINELVSNSLKHAFPTSTESDEIHIALQSNDDDQYTLIVADNGVGFPQNLDFCDIKSMGLQLVCVLVDQLEGDIELYRRDGTEFRVTFAARK